MKIVIDNSIIPQLTKELKNREEELEFYKRAYSNAQDVIDANYRRLTGSPCKKCFAYATWCIMCRGFCCDECDKITFIKCVICHFKLCSNHVFIDNVCEHCNNQN